MRAIWRTSGSPAESRNIAAPASRAWSGSEPVSARSAIFCDSSLSTSSNTARKRSGLPSKWW
jgi:hypothetical protein